LGHIIIPKEKKRSQILWLINSGSVKTKQERKTPETGGPEAVQALAVIVAAIGSARTGEVVSLAKVLAE